MKFPVTTQMLEEREFVAVKVGIRSEKLFDPTYQFEHIYLHVGVSMDEATYAALHSPYFGSYEYHRSKDSVPVTAKFVPYEDGYYFEITDLSNTLLAAERYSFIHFNLTHPILNSFS